jgi:hypothetical protein
MKICSSCKQVKNKSEFHSNRVKKDGLSSQCRSCKASSQRRWYVGHTKEQMERIQNRKTEYRNLNRQKIKDYLSVHPCVDCGEKDIIVLEFDHLKDKKFEICDMSYSYSWDSILKEIEKCEVRCANCHRRITHKRRLECKLKK